MCPKDKTRPASLANSRAGKKKRKGGGGVGGARAEEAEGSAAVVGKTQLTPIMKQKQQETQLTPVKTRKWQGGGGGGGCVIEARGISYKIYTAGPGANPFKIWSAKDDTSSDGGGEDERKGCAATAASASAGQDRCPLQQQSKLTAIAEDGGEGYDTGDDEECGGGRHRLHPLKTPQQDKGGATGAHQQHVRHVLRDVTCRARPWEVLAIVGPSGAGKSTLLEIMAGRLPLPTTAPHAVLVDGEPLDPASFRMSSGYVPQKDTLFPLLTVRETLLFTARLRLGLRGEALVAKVESLLGELGLAHVAAARVGDDRCRGISGGERRRVSIGVEVIHDPGVLILDEPTSGLDSSSALQIVDMLRTMAEVRGRTVVLSIHQPGFRIVKMFNSILLLAGGAVVHHGSVDKLQEALRAAGLEQPPYTNVVEFAMDSIDALRRYQRRQMQTKKLQLLGAAAAATHMPASAAAATTPNPDRCTLEQLFLRSKAGEEPLCNASPPVITGGLCCSTYANSWPTETAILTHRYLKNVFRTKELFACRTIQMLVSGLVLGSIFYHLPSGLASARERVGLFAFLLTFLLSSTTEALPIFLQERAILMKEASGGSYRVSSYAVANALAFLPFLLVLSLLFSVPLYWLVGLDRSPSSFLYFLLLIWLVLYTANSVVACFGAVAPNFIVGNSLINGVLGAFFLFSGYFIRKEEMPSYWVFMHYISLFKYPFEGFLVNEFRDRCLEQGKAGICLVRGGDVMREVGLDEESRWRNVAVMVGLIALYRFFAYVFLACRCRCAQKGGLRRALT